jgi:hypothetical protein
MGRRGWAFVALAVILGGCFPAVGQPIGFVGPHSCSHNGLGYVSISGKVRNTTAERTFRLVKVRATVTKGAFTGEGYADVDAGALGPGQEGRYTISVRDPAPAIPANQAECRVAVASYQE